MRINFKVTTNQSFEDRCFLCSVPQISFCTFRPSGDVFNLNLVFIPFYYLSYVFPKQCILASRYYSCFLDSRVAFTYNYLDLFDSIETFFNFTGFIRHKAKTLIFCILARSSPLCLCAQEIIAKSRLWYCTPGCV